MAKTLSDYNLHARWYLRPSPCLEITLVPKRRRSLRRIISALWHRRQGQ